MDYFGDEETKKRWAESRCTHVFKSGNKCGTTCQLKKKDGYDKCYAHLSRYDKIDYDIAKGTEPSLIEARIARKVDKARYSIRKCRYLEKHGELPENFEMPDMITSEDPRLTHRGRPFENKLKPIKIKKEKPPPPPPPAKEEDEELLTARQLCLEEHMDALIKVASKECGKVFRKKLYNKIIACCEEGIVVPDDLWYRYNSTFITQKERKLVQPFYELFQPPTPPEED
jgi:hypothetical protein